ncbi:MAG: phosphoribosylformylglycinamidine cyclo-ligase, partial [Chloroflexota bacterium]
RAGCALIGGETAEMPGVYAPNEVDVVGTIVGMLDKPNLLDGTRISASDVIFGLPSSGLHTNGFTLARMALAEQDWTSEHPALGMTIGEALLAVHKNYVADVDKLNDAGVDVRGLAHITGGGMVENLPRILPDGVEAVIERGSWAIPPIFGLIQTLGNISRDEMLRVFNMGVGMIVIVPESDAGTLSSTLPEAYRIGQIVASENEDEGTVRFEG